MARAVVGMRVLWFVALWLGGVLSVTAVGLVIRMFLAAN